MSVIINNFELWQNGLKLNLERLFEKIGILSGELSRLPSKAKSFGSEAVSRMKQTLLYERATVKLLAFIIV